MPVSRMCFQVLFTLACFAPAFGTENASSQRPFLDAVYVWGIAEATGTYEIGGELISTDDPAKFAEADSPSKAAILGVNNIVMAGAGLPNDAEVAKEISRSVAHLDRCMWEFNPDDKSKPTD